MEKRYKKVNTGALEGVLMIQNGIYGKVGVEQYMSIVYFAPQIFTISVPDLVSISILLTGCWDGVKVVNPDARDTTHQYLRLLASVDDLLPEFIVEGEFFSDETEKNPEDDGC